MLALKDSSPSAPLRVGMKFVNPNMIEWFVYLPLIKQILFIYLVIINIIAFFYFGLDKLKAQLSHQRVSEKMLWLLALIGGSIGTLLGMNFFRHKTQKMSFQAGIAIILALQVILIFWILK